MAVVRQMIIAVAGDDSKMVITVMISVFLEMMLCL
jgi:hypothetical protein